MNSPNPLIARNSRIYFLIVLLAIVSSCNKEDSRILKDENSILSFSLKKNDGTKIAPSSLTIRFQRDSILITVPSSTDVSQLIPEIEISGVNISPLSGVKQNFTNPVSYTVTAENGNSKKYTVVIKAASIAFQSLIFFGNSDSTFYASTGETLWRKQVLNNSASVTVSDGTVYIGGGGTYHFYAFDAVTGIEKWRFFINNGLMTSSPVVVDEFGIAHHPGDSGKQD